MINACKYSADSTAKVGLRVKNKGLVVSVEDKGSGMPEDKLSTIFQPFYRLEENSYTEGFGLGLSFADRIIKLHKGKIVVQSEEGVGTSFFIHLPSAASLHSN